MSPIISRTFLQVSSLNSTDPARSLSVWRRVAFVEEFFDIISCYHSSSSKGHLSAKRTLLEVGVTQEAYEALLEVAVV